jgi:hypothetical protein
VVDLKGVLEDHPPKGKNLSLVTQEISDPIKNLIRSGQTLKVDLKGQQEDHSRRGKDPFPATQRVRVHSENPTRSDQTLEALDVKKQGRLTAGKNRSLPIQPADRIRNLIRINPRTTLVSAQQALHPGVTLNIIRPGLISHHLQQGRELPAVLISHREKMRGGKTPIAARKNRKMRVLLPEKSV